MEDTLIQQSALDFIAKNYMEVQKLAEAERKPQSAKPLVEFAMFISKANLDNRSGKMLWAATGSDTKKDSFQEEMSVELFRSFLDYIDHGVNLPIYLSLAHYSRLKGHGEAGVATDIYIDGSTLKAKGYFSDTPLGTKIYNAIRKDRRDNIPQDKRVRISIGFYDQMHQHSNGTIWEYKSGKPCLECAKHGKGGKTYLSGVLEHFAVTRVPVNKRTDIVAKSEGKDMTTRYEDALSIVEDTNLVDTIEKAAQEEMQERSVTENLVVKADNPNPVGNAADLQVPDIKAVSPNNPTLTSYQILSGLPKETLLQLFGKIEADGTLSKDDISELINNIMNQLTDRSKVSGVDVSSDKPEKKKKDVVAGENKDTKTLDNIAGHTEMSQTTLDGVNGSGKGTTMSKSKDTDGDEEDKNEGPEGSKTDAEDKKEKKVKKSEQVELEYANGGKSTDDTQPDSVKLLGSVEQLISVIRELIARPASVATIGEPVENAKEPKGDYNQPLANDAPDLTTDNNQRGPGKKTEPEPDGSWDEASPIKGIVSDFSESMKNAITKSGSERLVLFQEIINKTGNQMREIHESLNQNQTANTKSEGQPANVNVEEVVNRILDEKLVPIQAGFAEMKSLIQGLAVGKANNSVEKKQMEIPQMKSIVSPTGVPQVQRSQIMSIAEIAKRTTIDTLR